MASVFQPVADRLNRLKKQLLYQNQQVNQLTYFTEADNHNRLSVYQIKITKGNITLLIASNS